MWRKCRTQGYPACPLAIDILPGMRKLILLAFSLSLVASLHAAEWVLIRTIDGTELEGQTQLKSVPFERDGRASAVSLTQFLSVHNAAPASDFETGRITQGLAVIQDKDRGARDLAVEELTAIGIPVLTPLLKAYKDTDQHEPRPLYRLFERVIPSYADGPDRALSMVRMKGGEAIRGKLGEGNVEVKTADGKQTTLPWSKIRTLAVRQKSVGRSMQVHALSHSTQIEFLDTGVVLSAATKADLMSRGFVRLSWETDSWASEADGIKVPGAPAYKTNLVDGFPFGSLVARIGAKGENFLISKKAMLTGKPAGRLRLAVNDNAHWQNNIGTFYVSMTATDAYDLGDAQ
jgi:hypothetical protein